MARRVPGHFSHPGSNSAPVLVRPIASSRLVLSVTGMGNQLQLQWPLDHTGWLQQTQTNLAGITLGTNWQPWPDSDNTNSVFFQVDPAAGSIFFRLAHPAN